MNQTGNPPSPTPPFGSDMPTQEIPVPHAGAAQTSYAFLQPPVEKDELGRLGQYRVLRVLGVGGMGMVFLAEDLSLRRPVALKVMRPEFIKNKEKDESRFLREARAMAAIKHARLVTLYHADKVGDTIYLVMELLQGDTLQKWLDDAEPAELADVVRMARDVALGLQAIHDAGLVHRDLKPSNLWLESPSGRVKILDFGLARAVSNSSTQITEAGFLIGTPAFLSPEQARGQQADFLSDLFSLGCVLYCMCTRKLPFPAQNHLDQLAAITRDDPPPPRSFNPDLPRPLVDLVLQLLAKDPRQRPQSAAEVAERLQQIKRQLTGRTRKGGSERLDIRLPKQPFVQRHAMKLLVGAGVLAALAVIVVAVILVLPHESPKKAPERKDPLAVAEKPGAVVFLDALKPTQTRNWPFDEFKGPKDGKPAKGLGPAKGPPGWDGRVTVNNVVAAHGIFMHPAPHKEPAGMTYALDKKFRRFLATVALNDTAAKERVQPVTFSVFGDDNLLWRSKPVSVRADMQDCAVSVKDVTSLRIQVDVDGEPKGAHAVWVEPRLEK